MDMDSLDYDTIIGAYEKVNKDFFYTARKEHVLVILSHSVYDMSSQELILRQSAYRLLLCFVEFATEILDGKDKSDECCWNTALIQQTIRNFLLKHIGNAMTRETSVQKVSRFKSKSSFWLVSLSPLFHYKMAALFQT